MSESIISLHDRRILRITGADSRRLLQGLITNNVELLDTQPGLFSALLTPQGKFLHDFFLVRQDDAILLETEATQMPGLLKRLTMYRLRADVTFEALDDWYVFAIMDDSEVSIPSDSVIFADPRHEALGRRMLSPMALPGSQEETHYEAQRLKLGIPEGWKDAVVERSLLLEMGYDQLHAIDFHKGCYVGQEVTARSKHRGQLRKYLHHISAAGELPDFGTDIVTEDGALIGDMRSHVGNKGLALIHVEKFQDASSAGKSILVAGQPVEIAPLAWMQHEVSQQKPSV